MDSRLNLLAVARPEWFTFSEEPGTAGLLGWAAAPETIWRENPIELRLRPEATRVSVAERVPGTRLPEQCPERHLQGDLTFCLGLDALPVTNADEAALWWAYLGQWLILQSIAAETGRWPPGHELDHGSAGEFHREAMALADQLGLTDEYQRMHDGLPSWVSDQTPQGSADVEVRLHGGSPSPNGCEIGGGLQGAVSADLRQGEGVVRLLELERARREALARYWTYQRAAGLTCCGTMVGCPLRQVSSGGVLLDQGSTGAAVVATATTQDTIEP